MEMSEIGAVHLDDWRVTAIFRWHIYINQAVMKSSVQRYKKMFKILGLKI